MFEHQIICGDATTELRTLPAESVDLVVTDPPYLCNYRDRSGRRIRNDTRPGAVLPCFPELYRVLAPDSYCILFCGWTALPQFSGAWAAAGFRTGGHIVWEKAYASGARHVAYRHESAWVLIKGRPQPRGDPLADVQAWTYSGNRRHPTEKSVEIILPLIRSFSRLGDVVLDPFLGSGTTAVAAALAGRQAIGIEIEPRYCDLARQRVHAAERALIGNVAA